MLFRSLVPELQCGLTPTVTFSTPLDPFPERVVGAVELTVDGIEEADVAAALHVPERAFLREDEVADHSHVFVPEGMGGVDQGLLIAAEGGGSEHQLVLAGGHGLK